MSLDAAILTQLQTLVTVMEQTGQRQILGLVGPPGSGKSTLAQQLLDTLGEEAVVVPMDGFHLAQAELNRLGRAQRKGAPDTFDSAGYVQLLMRLRTQTTDRVVYAPQFDRHLEEPIAGSIAVTTAHRYVITEGNYLLMDAHDAPSSDWQQVRPLLDACWYLDTNEPLRHTRLLARHMQHGRSSAEAKAWMHAVDEPNAQRIAATRARASCCLTWN